MTKKTRLIILSICAVLFLIITPYIVFYSLGYRVDFENKKIVATGGIYVRAMPNPVDVVIDSKITNSTGLFSSAIFVQNLLPTLHTLAVKKEGYFDYQKNVQVKEKEVAKLEHIILFKKDIPFEILPENVNSPFDGQEIQEDYTMRNSALYYSATNTDTALSATQKSLPILEDIITYKVTNNSIIWLANDGFLYRSSLDGLPAQAGKEVETLTSTALTLGRKNTYEIFTFSQRIFLKENSKLLILNAKTKTLENFYSSVKDTVLSPNGQKIILYNDHEILYSFLNSDMPEKIFLNRFSEEITDVQWINDDYIIFTLGGKIMISELDQNQPNIITLPQALTINGAVFDIKNAKIQLNQQDKKLYILAKETVLISERLIP